MIDQRSQVIEQARQRLDPWPEDDVAAIAECENGLWYLDKNIVQPKAVATVRNHRRVLKYARNFQRTGATVGFVKETPPDKTPDLRVQFSEWTVFVEVGELDLNREGGSTHEPAMKVVTAIERKRSQLPDGEIGFVAIDNFDINVESMPEEGFTHTHIRDGLCEVDRLGREHPEGWKKPSGVIVAASTPGAGIGSTLAHYIWTNPHATQRPDSRIIGFIRSSLPDSELFDAGAYARQLEL